MNLSFLCKIAAAVALLLGTLLVVTGSHEHLVSYIPEEGAKDPVFTTSHRKTTKGGGTRPPFPPSGDDNATDDENITVQITRSNNTAAPNNSTMPPSPTAALLNTTSQVPPPTPGSGACNELQYTLLGVLCHEITYHRSKEVNQTYGRFFPQKIFFSSQNWTDLPTVVVMNEPPNSRIHIGFKFMRMLHYTYHVYMQTHDDVHWVFWVDDDTYVYPERLNELLCSKNYNDSLLIGRVVNGGTTHHISGGAGFLISKQGMQVLAPYTGDAGECIQRHRQGDSDFTLSVCLDRIQNQTLINRIHSPLFVYFDPTMLPAWFQPGSDIGDDTLRGANPRNIITLHRAAFLLMPELDELLARNASVQNWTAARVAVQEERLAIDRANPRGV